MNTGVFCVFWAVHNILLEIVMFSKAVEEPKIMKELDYGKVGMRIRQVRKAKDGRKKNLRKNVASVCRF